MKRSNLRLKKFFENFFFIFLWASTGFLENWGCSISTSFYTQSTTGTSFESLLIGEKYFWKFFFHLLMLILKIHLNIENIWKVYAHKKFQMCFLKMKIHFLKNLRSQLSNKKRILKNGCHVEEEIDFLGTAVFAMLMFY